MSSPVSVREWAGPRSSRGGSSFFTPVGSDFIGVAWVGRTSTYDAQDPTLSLPRQLRNSTDKLPANAAVVAHFYDIESGRLDLDKRGKGKAHERFNIPIPRDGGIDDLLAEAERPDRRFDIVICEDISRIGRKSYISTQIENRLEQAGVILIAADEPYDFSRIGRRSKRSTQILTRRVKQGVSEWYVTEMLEKSWDGFEEHAQQGFNIGKPCYGFRAESIPHPVGAKRARGMKKTRLVADAIECAVVQKIYQWRIAEQLAYQAIADRLNADLVLNPPPVPVDPTRAVGRWTYSNVREVLTQPKYTGYMVWNRRARKGAGRNRTNPMEEWVWSPMPIHEAIIDLDTWLLAQEVHGQKDRSRSAAGKNRKPGTKRVYRLRSYITCTMCGRRMCGNTMKGHVYYACNPKPAWRGPDHPGAIRVREDQLLEALEGFLNDRVFGTYRHRLDDDVRADRLMRGQREHHESVAAIEKAMSDNEAKSRRLVSALEIADDLDQALLSDISRRRAELDAEHRALAERRASLLKEAAPTENPGLLDELPVGSVDLGSLPDEVSRRLFESLRLEIGYDHDTRTAAFKITLIGETIDSVSTTATQIVGIAEERSEMRSAESRQARAETAARRVEVLQTALPGAHRDVSGHRNQVEPTEGSACFAMQV